METYLIWYTSGAKNEKVPRLITAASMSDAINRFGEIVKDWNEILSVEIHYIEVKKIPLTHQDYGIKYSR